jgi:hypothetical protein
LKAPFHVGGLFNRSRRRSRDVVFDVPFALLLFSAAVGLRPVRPRASTIPAALPRCLVRRRLV